MLRAAPEYSITLYKLNIAKRITFVLDPLKEFAYPVFMNALEVSQLAKIRLDLLLVRRELAESREKAQRLIRAGLVHTPSDRLEKPGQLVDEEIQLTVKGPLSPYVSRGGQKLEGALEEFGLEPAGSVALDLGASTGGFTDCLLQRGARLVYAVDVGRGQLHRRLETDSRVISRERTHLDTLEPEQFDPRPSLAVADLSFISLRRAFPVLRRVLTAPGEAIVLVKPQFEAGRENVPKSGVITDTCLHRKILTDMRKAVEENGFSVCGECKSPIAGADGNQEYFLYLRVEQRTNEP